MSEKWTPPSWAASRAQEKLAPWPRPSAADRAWRRQVDPLNLDRAADARLADLLRTPGVAMMRANTARRSERALSTNPVTTDSRRAA